MSGLPPVLPEEATFVASHATALLAVGAAALLLAATLAPLRTLRWWGDRVRVLADRSASAQPQAGSVRARASRYLVYVRGIDAFSEVLLTGRETGMLDQLERRVAGLAVVRDVFPYDVAAEGLRATPLGRLWYWLHGRRRGPARILSRLIQVRNLLQVAISADPRYGPVYNYGISEAIVRALTRHGYPSGGAVPVTLLAYSGGAQLAVGAARYLRGALGAPIVVVSIGGVISDDPGLAEVQQLHHLYGTRDMVHRLGAVLWPGRWPVAFRSAWNRARVEGRITMIRLGPMRHTGRRAYLDRTSRLADGTTYLEATLDVVARIVSVPLPAGPGRDAPV